MRDEFLFDSTHINTKKLVKGDNKSLNSITIKLMFLLWVFILFVLVPVYLDKQQMFTGKRVSSLTIFLFYHFNIIRHDKGVRYSAIFKSK